MTSLGYKRELWLVTQALAQIPTVKPKVGGGGRRIPKKFIVVQEGTTELGCGRLIHLSFFRTKFQGKEQKPIQPLSSSLVIKKPLINRSTNYKILLDPT
jgi:hypothetical protein